MCTTRTPKEHEERGGNDRVLLAIFRRHPHSNINELAHLSGPVSARRESTACRLGSSIPANSPHPVKRVLLLARGNARRSLAALVFVESWPR